MLNLLSQNLLSPAILFFALGICAGLMRSDLEVPKSISRYLSIYLMMAIGLKGGVAFASTPQFGPDLVMTIVAGLAFGLLQPVLGFACLKLTTNLDRATAAAVSAHYGSISIVTFATAVSYLKLNDIAYAGYIVAVVALMEAPAIVSGLLLGRGLGKGQPGILRDALTNGAVVLLLGTFFIGCIIGETGLAKIEGFVVTPYQGLLCLFLLDMGLLVARKLPEVRQFPLRLALFGLYMPIIGAAIGLGLARLIGLDEGTGFLFTVLCASASYIAVPAAMRLALPEAQPAVYLPMSLAITFPFNIALGLPIYLEATRAFL